MKFDPSDPRLQKAIAFHQSGKLAEAEKQITGLLEDFPKMPHLWAHLGTIRLQQGHPTQALEAFDKSLALDDSFSPAWGSRAQTLEKLGRLEEARAGYDRALKAKPEAWLYFNRGNVLRDLGRLEEALESYGEALKTQPPASGGFVQPGGALPEGPPGSLALEIFDGLSS